MLSRRNFLTNTAAVGGGLFCDLISRADDVVPRELSADLVIIGGGLGGCAAAISALRNGLTVVMTESTDWIGGQLTSQAVPPDEHRWIETHGANASYRELRTKIRAFYRDHYSLTDAARAKPFLNPGNGSVSRLCHEPRVALSVLHSLLAPFASSGALTLMHYTEPVSAEVDRDRIRAVTVKNRSGMKTILAAPTFVDATELGDLLPMTKTEYVTGAESQADTGEMHAASVADPTNQQAFTMCFAIDYIEGEDHTIGKPRDYAFWRSFVPKMTPAWPGRLLDFTYTHPRSGTPKRLGFNPMGDKHNGVVNLWKYRRLIDENNFTAGNYRSDISLVNWPQNDYVLGNLIDVSADEAAKHIDQAKQLSLSLLHWLQTEAPRIDGGQGFPGLRLRPDIVGTEDGLAKTPYVRESRRIRAMTTVVEQHVGAEQRESISKQSGDQLVATPFDDSVGIGSYAIDLHPSSAGDNYIDFPTLPFQIPLSAMLPVRVENLLPACKNIGVTHVTGGCYRLHPVEWSIGEAAGALAGFCKRKKKGIREVSEQPSLVADFQTSLRRQGVETSWPSK